MHKLSSKRIRHFQKTIYDHYKLHGRSFKWRETRNPYHIWLSEIMLQQTQTSRVTMYYETFLTAFPSVQFLAKAEKSKILSLWQGLGYNRRALNLHTAAKTITTDFDGDIPDDKAKLLSLPGIGDATAGAILCYAFDKPEPFIETNIRTVFIHEFFGDEESVADRELMPLVQYTLDEGNPREWFYALTDYGVHIKKTLGNMSRKSKQYNKQSKFEGSNRQKRSMILRELLSEPQSTNNLVKKLGISKTDIEKPLEELVTEKFITLKNDKYRVI